MSDMLPNTSENKPQEHKLRGDLEDIKNDTYNRELYRVKSSHWVDPIPNELVIQEKSISVIRRDLFTAQVETWPIEDIGEITLIDAPIFAALHMKGKFPEHKLDMNGIPKRKAKTAKELINGLMLEEQGKVDVPEDLDIKTRAVMLAKAGRIPESVEPPVSV